MVALSFRSSVKQVQGKKDRLSLIIIIPASRSKRIDPEVLAVKLKSTVKSTEQKTPLKLKPEIVIQS